MQFWIAFVTGLAGSLHCAGMCGIIAISVSAHSKHFYPKLWYNLGRILSYSLVGGILGFMGRSFFMMGYQQYISIGVGIVMLISVLFPTLLTHFRIGSRWNQFIKRQFSFFLQKKSIFLTGFVNGFLPCGLSYLAFLGAIASGDAWSGFLYMGAFGLGTLPMLFSIAFLGQWLSAPIRSQWLKFAPYLILLMGILFILRGMNLGIPYLSPSLDTLDCH